MNIYNLKGIFLLRRRKTMLNVAGQAEELIVGQAHHPPHPSLPST